MMKMLMTLNFGDDGIGNFEVLNISCAGRSLKSEMEKRNKIAQTQVLD